MGNEPVILSPDDVQRNTGLKRPSAQTRWLETHGWRFIRNANGDVIVHALEAERQLCGGQPSRRAAERREEPDLEALKRL